MNFIDFEKAFDRDDRNVIWKFMHHYGIPSKLIKLIQDLIGAEEDVKSRLGKARVVLNKLTPVWNASPISTKTKLRIFTANVKATLLYGSETWKVTQALLNKRQSFVNKCLRKILEIQWQEKNTSKELWNFYLSLSFPWSYFVLHGKGRGITRKLQGSFIPLAHIVSLSYCKLLYFSLKMCIKCLE